MTSVLDQYEQASQLPARSSSNAAKATPLTGGGFISMRFEESVPTFSKQRMNFNPSDTITHLAVANDNLALAMANGKIFRIDLKRPDNYEELPLPKQTPGGQRISNIFLDPLGCHLLVAVTSHVPKNQQAPEHYPELLYLNKRSNKIKSVGKSKNYDITQIGWNYENASEATTGPVLLGTSKGLLLETEICVDGDKMFQSGIEQYWKQLPNYFPIYGSKEVDELAFDIGKGSHTPITGIEFRRINGSNKYIIFVTTSKRLYQFIGSTNNDEKPLFQSIFNRYLKEPETGFIGKTSLDCSKLQFYNDKNSIAPKYFGWSTGEGIFYGQINSTVPDKCKTVIVNDKMIKYPQSESIGDEKKSDDIPLSFVLTEFHSLLLYRDHIRGVSLLNDELVYEDYYPESSGKLINIVKDPTKHVIWVIAENSIYRYKVFKEHRNVWQIYADKNDFESAKKYCENNPAYLDKIYIKEAELLFQKGEYSRSAEIYSNTQSTFENVCLKFLDANKVDALKLYLKRKLEMLNTNDKIQITMLVVWLVELYLSQLGEMRYNRSHNNSSNYANLQREFETFLTHSNVKDCIRRNRPVIYDLMASHGDKDNLIMLTVMNADYENVVRQHVYKKSYVEALGVLKSQNDRELFYQFAPVLMQEIPKATVTALIEQGKSLNPTKLLPALVSCEADSKHVKEMIKYLEFCTHQLGCGDRAIHNYLLSLYVKYEPDALMNYLLSQGQVMKAIHYDVHYALRMCREKQLTEACVHLSSILGLWESAVELALPVNIALAKKIANMSDDPELRKKLWLKIAEFVINEKQDVPTAMEFLQHCDLIKIEDLLPFFSDFVTIDHFRDPICNSLQEYNQQIQYLREEMEEATRSADQVRSEIQTFRNRCTVINVNEVCILCDITLLIRPFYMFPCGHKFHADCLTMELQPLLGPAKQNKLANLNRQLNSLCYPVDAASDLFSEKIDTKEQLKNEIDNILASECLYCGEYMIQAIDTPFISDSDWDRVMKEWE